ncbi:MAG TPA: lysylphosphatidylglycerol synthase domain-containing protein [Methylomirabilota bacterium]|nr:lysylphosphatidylglycerol synthase domain-containing protein [Methylomirabilota bacterium]
MRVLRALAIAIGLAVVGWLVWRIGPGALAAELRRLGWRLPLILLPPAGTNLLQTLGWRFAFPRRRPRLRALIPIRLAGEAINDTTPTGTLGGDAVKALLVARMPTGVPIAEAFVSVVLAKSMLVAALGAFLAAGLALAWLAVGASAALLSILALLAAFAAGSGVAFVAAQLRGLFRMGGRALTWLGLGARAASVTHGLDAELRTSYRSRRGPLAISLALHLAGWAVGTFETWLALAFLGAPVPLATALVLEAGATGVRSAGFLVPGSLGIQEGGIVGIATLLGIPPDTGLALGLVRRIREGTFIALGYACLAALPAAARRRTSPAVLPER